MEKNPPNLVALPSSTRARPPGTLGEAGLSLWNRVVTEYDIHDCGGLEMLFQACSASAQVCQRGPGFRLAAPVASARSLGVRARTISTSASLASWKPR
jgi:hypothetical protein